MMMTGDEAAEAMTKEARLATAAKLEAMTAADDSKHKKESTNFMDGLVDSQSSSQGFSYTESKDSYSYDSIHSSVANSRYLACPHTPGLFLDSMSKPDCERSLHDMANELHQEAAVSRPCTQPAGAAHRNPRRRSTSCHAHVLPPGCADAPPRIKGALGATPSAKRLLAGPSPEQPSSVPRELAKARATEL
eukprot:gene8480-4841_t